MERKIEAEPSLFSWELFSKMPIVGIIRNLTLAEIRPILPCYVQAGLTTVEITMNTAGAADSIRYISEKYPSTLNVGAGSVCNLRDLERALAAGAQFIVTPLVDEDVIRFCVANEVPIFPGACSPTEIYKAWSLGAPAVKLFPAQTLGIGYLKELNGPFSQIKLLPTGGVNLENCTDFLSAGAIGLGIGGQLFDSQLIKVSDWGALAEHFSRFVAKITNYRGQL